MAAAGAAGTRGATSSTGTGASQTSQATGFRPVLTWYNAPEAAAAASAYA